MAKDLGPEPVGFRSDSDANLKYSELGFQNIGKKQQLHQGKDSYNRFAYRPD